jgi:hypothetical protein
MDAARGEQIVMQTKYDEHKRNGESSEGQCVQRTPCLRVLGRIDASEPPSGEGNAKARDRERRRIIRRPKWATPSPP